MVLGGWRCLAVGVGEGPGVEESEASVDVGHEEGVVGVEPEVEEYEGVGFEVDGSEELVCR